MKRSAGTLSWSWWLLIPAWGACGGAPHGADRAAAAPDRPEAPAPASPAKAQTPPAAAAPEQPAAPADKPGPGRWIVHVVDVGSGLGVFVDGPDFTLVYDAGSNDDTADGEKNRFVAYLNAVHPQIKTIDHVILGHPHKDHMELLGDVLSRFDVKEFWESGVPNAECRYQQLIKTIKEKNIKYHSAMQGPGDRRIDFKKPCGDGPAGYQMKHADRVESGLRVKIGEDASMTFSYAAPKPQPDLNDNSLVVRLDLGKSRVLVMGDVGAGGRDDPASPPKRGSVEGELVRTKSDIKSDVLVVGNHGSTASSRKVLIDMINPKVSVISSGPAEYGGNRLPEATVVSMLEKRAPLFRTDKDDATCGANAAKIGADADGKPGGCNNVRIVVQDGAPPKAGYFAVKD
jgi:beta-lactamase superfamily II metal-dependent hydrolase